MKAMVLTGFGGPEMLEMRDVPTPKPRANQLLVKVVATSVNPVDFKIRKAGERYGVRPPLITGGDVSGIVEEVGEDVTEYAPGDEVFFMPNWRSGQGSYCEFTLADESIVALKPQNLSHEEAAAIPLAGSTAWEGLLSRALVSVGDTVLIHGGGGVGSLAVQIAKAAGAVVYCVCSDKTIEIIEQCGADRPINYKTEQFIDVVRDELGEQGMDIVFDGVGGDTLARSLEIVSPYGSLVEIVGADGNLNPALQKNLTFHFVFVQQDGATMQGLRELAERGLLAPVIDSVMALQQAGEAQQRLEAGGLKGKIVLRVSEQ